MKNFVQYDTHLFGSCYIKHFHLLQFWLKFPFLNNSYTPWIFLYHDHGRNVLLQQVFSTTRISTVRIFNFHCQMKMIIWQPHYHLKKILPRSHQNVYLKLYLRRRRKPYLRVLESQDQAEKEMHLNLTMKKRRTKLLVKVEVVVEEDIFILPGIRYYFNLLTLQRL